MFADYAALKSAVISWADNDEVTARVDDFIALCHTRLNRVLRLEDMSVLSLFDLDTDTGPWVPKPEGYMGMRRLKLDGVAGGGLDYKTLTEFDEDYSLNQPGEPSAYVVMADRIRLGPIPNGEWTLEVLYYKRVPTLSDTVTTNVFLDVVSDLLLYGSLLEAEPWLKDSEMFSYWQGQFAQGLRDVDVDTEAQRFPSGDLAVRSV